MKVISMGRNSDGSGEVAEDSETDSVSDSKSDTDSDKVYSYFDGDIVIE